MEALRCGREARPTSPIVCLSTPRRELWGDHVSLVASEDERLLCFLDGQPLKSEAVEALDPSDASRVKTKTVPAALL